MATERTDYITRLKEAYIKYNAEKKAQEQK
jgi:hypothetical protein